MIYLFWLLKYLHGYLVPVCSQPATLDNAWLRRCFCHFTLPCLWRCYAGPTARSPALMAQHRDEGRLDEDDGQLTRRASSITRQWSWNFTTWPPGLRHLWRLWEDTPGVWWVRWQGGGSRSVCLIFPQSQVFGAHLEGHLHITHKPLSLFSFARAHPCVCARTLPVWNF